MPGLFFLLWRMVIGRRYEVSYSSVSIIVYLMIFTSRLEAMNHLKSIEEVYFRWEVLMLWSPTMESSFHTLENSENCFILGQCLHWLRFRRAACTPLARWPFATEISIKQRSINSRKFVQRLASYRRTSASRGSINSRKILQCVASYCRPIRPPAHETHKDQNSTC